MNAATDKLHAEIDKMAKKLELTPTYFPPLANPSVKISLLRHLAKDVCRGELKVEMEELADWIEKVLAAYGGTLR